MGMRFEELNEATRSYMLSEFDDEQRSGSPFVGSDLSPAGREVFAQLVRAALEDNSDDTLIAAFDRPDLWASHPSPPAWLGESTPRTVTNSDANQYPDGATLARGHDAAGRLKRITDWYDERQHSDTCDSVVSATSLSFPTHHHAKVRP